MTALIHQVSSPESRAIALALETFQERFKEVTLTEIELEFSRSYQQWIAKVEGVDDEYGYEVKASSKELQVIEDKRFVLPENKRTAIKHQRQAIELEHLLPFDEIVRIAHEAMPDAEPIEYELEREGAVMEWEVVVKQGTIKYEIEIDGETGHVLEIEKD